MISYDDLKYNKERTHEEGDLSEGIEVWIESQLRLHFDRSKAKTKFSAETPLDIVWWGAADSNGRRKSYICCATSYDLIKWINLNANAKLKSWDVAYRILHKKWYRPQERVDFIFSEARAQERAIISLGD